MQSFNQNKETLKLRPKMPYLGIFIVGFEKTTDIFHATTLELVQMQRFLQYKNALKFRMKLFLFGYFWANILVTYYFI